MKHCIEGRQQNIIDMLGHITENKIQGDILDIGVYEGYSAVLAMNTLIFLKDVDRKIYLYDNK